MKIDTKIIDYNNPKQAKDLMLLFEEFALDPLSGSTELPDFTKRNLIQTLKDIPQAFTVICYKGDIPVALANCFYGFSTFACKPLINIHDFMVSKDHRGQGLSKNLLLKIEQIAIEAGCCKITLEALEHNHIARKTYETFGFKKYELDPEHGPALFFEKGLK